MLDALKVLCIAVGAYTLTGVALSIIQYFVGDRSGNSGRFGKHWTDED